MLFFFCVTSRLISKRPNGRYKNCGPMLNSRRVRYARCKGAKRFEGQETHLPLLHIILLPLILLNQLLQNLLQSFRISLERRSNILHRFLDQDSIDHSKALAVWGKGSQCLQYKSVSTPNELCGSRRNLRQRAECLILGTRERGAYELRTCVLQYLVRCRRSSELAVEGCSCSWCIAAVALAKAVSGERTMYHSYIPCCFLTVICD